MASSVVSAQRASSVPSGEAEVQIVVVLEHFVDHGPRVGEPIIILGRARERPGFGEIGAPAAAASMGHEPLCQQALLLHELARRRAAGPLRRDRLRQVDNPEDYRFQKCSEGLGSGWPAVPYARHRYRPTARAARRSSCRCAP